MAKNVFKVIGRVKFRKLVDSSTSQNQIIDLTAYRNAKNLWEIDRVVSENPKPFEEFYQACLEGEKQ